MARKTTAAALVLAALAVTAIGLLALKAPTEENPNPAGQEQAGAQEPLLGIEFGPTERFGITLKGKNPNNPQGLKKLTYEPRGETNNTCIKLDEQESLYGQTPGAWAVKPEDKKTPAGHPYHTSTWRYTEKVYVTQSVMIAPNFQTGELDTCLVDYLVENRDQNPHNVGLRMMLDTYVGATDGVPFLIPGQPGLLETKLDLDDVKKIPDFIQALEKPDLADPGTIVQMVLKLPSIVKLHAADPLPDPIDRMVISRWPKNPEIRWDFIRGPGRPTYWAMNDKTQGKNNDSCVTLYWNNRKMAAGEKRAMAFTYGLSNISSIRVPFADCALTYGGPPMAGGEFTVAAWIKDPKAGQKIQLDLPAGMSFAQDAAEQTIDKPTDHLSQVSWKVKIDESTKKGIYELGAKTGAAEQKLKVSVGKN